MCFALSTVRGARSVVASGQLKDALEVSVCRITTWKITGRGALLPAMLALGMPLTPAGAQQPGNAVVRVESRLEHDGLRFGFTGALEGTVGPGDSIEASGLVPGRYSVSQPAPSPFITLVDITCDDDESSVPSTGSVGMRAATFHIDDGETVTCTFVYDGFEEFIIPDELPDGVGSVAVPKEGVWNATNHEGKMVCDGLLSRDLDPVGDRGTITVLDDGERIFSDGFSDSTQDITMFRMPHLPGRYTGWVAGEHEGTPMIIHFVYQLLTDEWITGYMFADLVDEGLTCRFYRWYEIFYSGPA